MEECCDHCRWRLIEDVSVFKGNGGVVRALRREMGDLVMIVVVLRDGGLKFLKWGAIYHEADLLFSKLLLES